MMYSEIRATKTTISISKKRVFAFDIFPAKNNMIDTTKTEIERFLSVSSRVTFATKCTSRQPSKFVSKNIDTTIAINMEAIATIFSCLSDKYKNGFVIFLSIMTVFDFAKFLFSGSDRQVCCAPSDSYCPFERPFLLNFR